MSRGEKLLIVVAVAFAGLALYERVTKGRAMAPTASHSAVPAGHTSLPVHPAVALAGQHGGPAIPNWGGGSVGFTMPGVQL